MTRSALRCCTSIIRSFALVQASSSLSIGRTCAWPWRLPVTEMLFRHFSREFIEDRWTTSYIHTYEHAYIHTYVHTYIHTYIHVYTCTNIYISIHACMHVCVRTYIHSYVHTCVHIYKHLYIHTCMHACKKKPRQNGRKMTSFRGAMGQHGQAGSWRRQ